MVETITLPGVGQVQLVAQHSQNTNSYLFHGADGLSGQTEHFGTGQTQFLALFPSSAGYSSLFLAPFTYVWRSGAPVQTPPSSSEQPTTGETTTSGTAHSVVLEETLGFSDEVTAIRNLGQATVFPWLDLLLLVAGFGAVGVGSRAGRAALDVSAPFASLAVNPTAKAITKILMRGKFQKSRFGLGRGNTNRVIRTREGRHIRTTESKPFNTKNSNLKRRVLSALRKGKRKKGAISAAAVASAIVWLANIYNPNSPTRPHVRRKGKCLMVTYNKSRRRFCARTEKSNVNRRKRR